ncbi:hypothetical protein ACLF30_000985 [Cronobacter sakazakii]|uniref:hypothetical protein n=1 Tax=Cronobacter sakazakii TaxID=28141 RepID=UPI000B4BAD4C|nr:hypothetical protein [Cronobacter sakazakii]EJQ2009155.1 hypothetical protein [Cronobacter sakazakii]EJQ2009570.1 hypothetical protein [Cronobacter sakazakii]EJQ2087408.1 hypothetical protein [Cronobacter sakazakii]EJR9309070.1 hypothetical protein [Cronobacter sakazakii]EJR9313131.1 hypothetical protein [Cronobacter sakazakii]
MFGLLHKFSRQLPALILFWCINWFITLFLLAVANKTHHPSLIGAAIWFNMLWVCAYIIDFYGRAAFHTHERKRLKGFLPRKQYSKMKASVSLSRTAMLTISVSFLLAVAHAPGIIVWSLVAASCFFGAGSLTLSYLFCLSVLSARAASLLNKGLTLLLALVLFFARMIASGILLESWDISAVQLPYTTWSMTLFLAAFIMVNIAYIIVIIISSVMEASLGNRKKRARLSMDNQFIFVLAFTCMLSVLMIANVHVVGVALMNAFYQFDTRTTFRCGDRYQTIYELGEKVRYLAVGENQYRGFFLKDNDYHGVAVKCTTGDKFTWYRVLSRDELGENAPAKNRGDDDKR